MAERDVQKVESSASRGGGWAGVRRGLRRTFRSTRRETHKKAGITCSLADGIRFAWADPARRTAAAAVNRPLIETCCDRAAGLRKIEELRERAIALHREQAR